MNRQVKRAKDGALSPIPRKPAKIEFTQDHIPLKEIRNGIIETTDGKFIKILEIEPINFLLRSGEEQYNIIAAFASWLKISPMRLQFKSVTRKANSDKHVSMVCQELERETNSQCRALGGEYIKLIKDVGSREALTRRFLPQILHRRAIFLPAEPRGHRHHGRQKENHRP